jgi:hypothetical protein
MSGIHRPKYIMTNIANWKIPSLNGVLFFFAGKIIDISIGAMAKSHGYH